jgi:anti-sigma regulatory factor (Ser/Thr protein kinase)
MTAMRQTMPATLDAVESFVLEFRRLAEAILKASDRFTELLLREMLTNAVRHGSGCDPRRRVRCAVRLSQWRVSIAVADDGDGFDWRAAPVDSLEDPRTSGRGIEILRRYASRIRFNRKGNAAAIIKQFEETRQ